MVKKERTSERKEGILQVAVEIIHNKGFYKLTIRNIATKLSISEAAIYRHFKNKETIITELCHRVFQKNQYWNGDISLESPDGLLIKIMINQLKILGKEPQLSAILFQEEIFREYPKIGEEIKKHRERNENIIQKIVLKGQREGLFSKNIDPSVFALLYLGSIRIMVSKWREDNFNNPIEEQAEKVINQLLQFVKVSDKKC